MNCSNTIYKLTFKAQQGDDTAKLTIIENYSKLINKLSRKLNYEDATAELTLSLLEAITKLKYLGNEDEDKGYPLTKYFSKALKNKYIILSMTNNKIFTHEVALNSDQETEPIQTEDTEEIFINNLELNEWLDKLTKTQQIVIIEKYIRDFPDTLIAEHLNISRQAVNKNINAALKKLRKYISQN